MISSNARPPDTRNPAGRFADPRVPIEIRNEDDLLCAINSVEQLIHRTVTGEQTTFNGKRNLRTILGRNRDLRFENYREKWVWNGLARRAVELPVRATWNRRVSVRTRGIDDEAEDGFQQRFDELKERFGFSSVLRRADRLLDMSNYVVIVLRNDDGQELEQPVESIENGSRDLVWIDVFGDHQVTKVELDTDNKSPTWGQPIYYTVQQKGGVKLGQTAPIRVHRSRAVHLSRDSVDSQWISEPGMTAYWDQLEDVEKTVGGSAEMFWQGASRPYVVTAPEGVEIADMQAVQNRIRELIHGVQQFFAGDQGMDLHTLPSVQADPTPTFKTLIEIISAATGIPNRLLVGSERGELASTQDRKNFADSIDERRDDFAEPRVLRPFVDRLVENGIMPVPGEQGYIGQWPAAGVLDEQERADVASKRSKAMHDATAGTPESFFDEDEIREVVGFAPRDEESRIAAINKGVNEDESNPATRALPELVDAK